MSDYAYSTTAEIDMLKEWAGAGKLRALEGYIWGSRYRQPGTWGRIDHGQVLACAERLCAELRRGKRATDPAPLPFWARGRPFYRPDGGKQIDPIRMPEPGEEPFNTLDD